MAARSGLSERFRSLASGKGGVHTCRHLTIQSSRRGFATRLISGVRLQDQMVICPHCKSLGVPLWSKFWATSARPATCSSCKCQVVAARWPTTFARVLGCAVGSALITVWLFFGWLGVALSVVGMYAVIASVRLTVPLKPCVAKKNDQSNSSPA